MEKLIELLNEYKGKEERTIECGCPHNDWYGAYTYEHEELIIISKKFGFIKWLVDNDKIDRDEIIINSDFMPVAFDRKGEKYEWSEEKQLLMLLSIQDEPIQFLVSILK